MTRVLIACEFSGIVQQAFTTQGIEAWSCDLLPSENPAAFHYRGDIFRMLREDPFFSLMIAFPPCTHLAVSGARWFKDKQVEQMAAINFFTRLAAAPIERIAI